MRTITIVWGLVISCLAANAQEPELDLSKNAVSQTVDPQLVKTIILKNRLANKDTRYTVEVKKEQMQIPQLPAVPGLLSAAGDDACDDVKSAQNALDGEIDEKNIPAKVKTLLGEIEKANVTTCATVIASARLSIANTRQVIKLPVVTNLKKGEMMIITIKRFKTDGDSVVWKYEFRTQQENRWKVYFGFTYVPDMLTKFDQYYAKEDTGGTYLVTAAADRKNVMQNISPMVMFSYMFYKKHDQALKFGLTAGFTYNLQTLGALAGPSLIIGDHVSLNTGIAFLQKDRLMGKYNAGDRVQDNLEFDQLHEKAWTYDVYFSIGIGISELFKKFGKSSEAETEEKE